jgi:hypothetical protein
MTFVAFLIWVLIVAGTGYMLWKLIFESRFGKKRKFGPVAEKTEQAETESGRNDQPGEVADEAAGEPKAPEAATESEEEEVLEGEVVEDEDKPATKKDSATPEEVKTRVERYVGPSEEGKPDAETQADSSKKEK